MFSLQDPLSTYLGGILLADLLTHSLMISTKLVLLGMPMIKASRDAVVQTLERTGVGYPLTFSKRRAGPPRSSFNFAIWDISRSQSTSALILLSSPSFSKKGMNSLKSMNDLLSKMMCYL